MRYLGNYLTSGTLHRHLAEIDQACHERMEIIVSAMAKQEGVTEALKAAPRRLSYEAAVRILTAGLISAQKENAFGQILIFLTLKAIKRRELLRLREDAPAFFILNRIGIKR